jgi:tetratricopeptide (TPR) repeat protein
MTHSYSQIPGATGYEKALGAEHRSMLNTVNNLGKLYKNQGKMVEAEEMYMRALKGYEKALSAEHRSTLDTVHNLGNVCKNQGKMVEAEEMYMRSLKGKEKAFGAEHTSTLTRLTIWEISIRIKARWSRRRRCICGR